MPSWRIRILFVCRAHQVVEDGYEFILLIVIWLQSSLHPIIVANLIMLVP